MLIYIDTETGSWGTAEKELVVFDAEDEECEMLMGMSDSEVCRWGIDNRHRGC